MTISFRKAVTDDLEDIVEIYNSTIDSRMVTADTEPVTVDQRMDWFNNHVPNHRPLWVALDGQEICGWVSLESFYGRPAYDKTAEISIYISENFRGKGIGKIVLTMALDESAKLGIETLLGFIFAHNEPSIKLFERFGFEKWAHLPEIAELDNKKRNLVIMGKKL